MLQDWWRELLSGGGLLAVLAWLLRLERGKSDKEQIKDLLKRLDERDKEARESRSKLHAKVDQTNTNLSQVGERVARIEGRLGTLD